jgi:hypothetical protein
VDLPLVDAENAPDAVLGGELDALSSKKASLGASESGILASCLTAFQNAESARLARPLDVDLTHSLPPVR